MRYLIALGGNAIGDKKAIWSAAKVIANLYRNGNEIVVTHGNGPQVGMLAIEAHESLAILTAQTQAWIGLTIERSIARALEASKIQLSYSIPEVILTKTVVERSDRAFRNPEKPIGRFYTKAEASKLSRNGFRMKKLINGYRRVVPSPKAKAIVEKDLVLRLLRANRIVIACGGGGIPVFKNGNKLTFAEAVVDKDDASSLLATQIHADRFIILTSVDGIFLNFKKKGQVLLSTVTAKKLEEYLLLGYFEQGSMAPKARSCIDFVNSTHSPAAVGNINIASEVISNKKMTLVTN